MAQMWLLWWPRNVCTNTTAKSGGDSGAATRGTTGRRSSLDKNGRARSCCNCWCLAKFMRKVKKQSKGIVRSAGTSRQSSFQCRYDPLSYSLNFDTSGCGSSVDDEDYYHFYAFSSRFVANPRSRTTHMATAASQHSPSAIPTP